LRIPDAADAPITYFRITANRKANMHDEPSDTPETREAINATLRDILAHGGWGKSTWDAVVENLHTGYGIKTDLFELAQNALCLIRVFQAGAFVKNGIIGRQTAETLFQTIDKLVSIALHAEKGDEKASNQLQVLHKVAHPFSYDLPSTVIKKLADSYHTSPHLARAWDVRSLMLDLSHVVEPTKFDRSVLEGPVKLTTRDLHLIDRKLHATAEKHIKRGSTLLSLATSIYLETLDKEGIKIDPRQIRFDLEKLKEWEAVNLKDAPFTLRVWERPGEYPGGSIPAIPIYSDGWKRQWRRGDKGRKKLS
jgi:hypothetical protein